MKKLFMTPVEKVFALLDLEPYQEFTLDLSYYSYRFTERLVVQEREGYRWVDSELQLSEILGNTKILKKSKITTKAQQLQEAMYMEPYEYELDSDGEILETIQGDFSRGMVSQGNTGTLEEIELLVSLTGVAM